jgi:hypothetical protein
MKYRLQKRHRTRALELLCRISGAAIKMLREDAVEQSMQTVNARQLPYIHLALEGEY